MTSAKLLGIRRGGHEPGQEGALFDQGLPAGNIPTHVLGRSACGARLSTEKNDHGVCLGRDEAEEKHVFVTAVVALENGVAQCRVGVQLNFLMTGTD